MADENVLYTESNVEDCKTFPKVDSKCCDPHLLIGTKSSSMWDQYPKNVWECVCAFYLSLSTKKLERCINYKSSRAEMWKWWPGVPFKRVRSTHR